jgi:hypothetical protein
MPGVVVEVKGASPSIEMPAGAPPPARSASSGKAAAAPGPITVAETLREVEPYERSPTPPPGGLPRLTYFNARGRAEVVRIMCAEAGFEYEDYRFRPNIENECRAPEVHSSRPGVQCLCQTHGPGNDEFVRFRAAGKSITGQVPLMEIDGLKIVQTSAICRYLAHKLQLAGSTPAEAAYSDVVAATLDDLYIYMVQSMINRKVDVNFYVDQWPKVRCWRGLPGGGGAGPLGKRQGWAKRESWGCHAMAGTATAGLCLPRPGWGFAPSASPLGVACRHSACASAAPACASHQRLTC